ncbi:MAG: hypothetical protein Q7R70_01160 [Candidatus Diapherotrites archaeon]|nr:hypothetical protein [Candidatus Diapherotrites archaeon]
MKKILLISAVLLMLASFGSAAMQDLKIYSGWNIIPGGTSAGQINDSKVFGNAKYVWVYSPLDNKYYGGSLTVNGSVNGTSLPSNLYSNDSYLIPNEVGTGTWMYFSSPITLTINTDYSNSSSFLEKKLFKGWNFLSITQAMVNSGLNLNDFFKNCTLQGVYAWYPETQSWGNNAVTNGAVSADKLTQTMVGMTFVARVTSDCQLSGTPIVPNAPQLPA